MLAAVPLAARGLELAAHLRQLLAARPAAQCRQPLVQPRRVRAGRRALRALRQRRAAAGRPGWSSWCTAGSRHAACRCPGPACGRQAMDKGSAETAEQEQGHACIAGSGAAYCHLRWCCGMQNRQQSALPPTTFNHSGSCRFMCPPPCQLLATHSRASILSVPVLHSVDTITLRALPAACCSQSAFLSRRPLCAPGGVHSSRRCDM